MIFWFFMMSNFFPEPILTITHIKTSLFSNFFLKLMNYNFTYISSGIYFQVNLGSRKSLYIP